MAEHGETLRMLRRMDGKLDRVVAKLADIKPYLASLERQAGQMRVDLAGRSSRLDSIERRLGLVTVK